MKSPCFGRSSCRRCRLLFSEKLFPPPGAGGWRKTIPPVLPPRPKPGCHPPSEAFLNVLFQNIDGPVPCRDYVLVQACHFAAGAEQNHRLVSDLLDRDGGAPLEMGFYKIILVRLQAKFFRLQSPSTNPGVAVCIGGRNFLHIFIRGLIFTIAFVQG